MARLVFQKTAAGVAEIQSRGSSLPRPLRSLLILVNGRVPARALMNQAKGLNLPETVLADLVRRGLIEPVVQSGAAADADEAEDFAAPTSDSPQHTLVQLRSMDLARSYAAAYVREFAGEHSDALTELFENARTVPELLAIVENCAQVIAGIEGVEAAARFVHSVHRLVPPEPPPRGASAAKP